MSGVDDIVGRLQSAFGKRAILRNHHVARPTDAPRDRVRYLTDLRTLNTEFVAVVGDITVPPPASERLRRLLTGVNAESRLMASYISRPEMSSDVLAMRLEDLEQTVVDAFLSLLATLDPTSVATATRADETD
jgi:hypothetical protein